MAIELGWVMILTILSFFLSIHNLFNIYHILKLRYYHNDNDKILYPTNYAMKKIENE